MRIGNRLGVVVVGACSPDGGGGHRSGARRTTPSVSNRYPSGAPSPTRRATIIMASTSRPNSAAILTVNTTSGKVGPIVGPDGRERGNGAEVGMNAHGWYTFWSLADENDKAKPYTVETDIRPGRREHPKALELLLLADEVRRDPRAVGRRQRSGRHHAK